MERVDLLPDELVDAMPARLWVTANLFWLFDLDLHFCTNGFRSVELDGVEIGRGRTLFVGYPDDVIDEPLTRHSADAFLEFVALVARHLSREVEFTPESAEAATWRTRDTETGIWVDDSMVDVQTLSPAVFKLDGGDHVLTG